MEYLIASMRDQWREGFSPYTVCCSLYNPDTNVRYNLEVNLNHSNTSSIFKLSTQGHTLEWRGHEALAVWVGLICFLDAGGIGRSVALQNYYAALKDWGIFVVEELSYYMNGIPEDTDEDPNPAWHAQKLADQFLEHMPTLAATS